MGLALDPLDPLDLPAYGSHGSNRSAAAAAAAAAAALTELSILESNTRKQPGSSFKPVSKLGGLRSDLACWSEPFVSWWESVGARHSHRNPWIDAAESIG